jgi:hypothetical protein
MIASPRPQARRRMSLALTAAGATALLAAAFAGCSQPAPRVPRGAFSLKFQDAGMCGPGFHDKKIGDVTATNRTTLIEDEEMYEEKEVTVSCSVVDKTGTYFFEALESTPDGTSLTLFVGELSPDATIDSPSKGTVAYMSPETAGSFTSNDCNFYFLDGHGVQPGTVWLAFDCAAISTAPDNVCQITDGVAAFEQCETVSD